MTEAAIISAVYTEWKMIKTRSALVLCFEVPLEQQAMVQDALGTPLPDQSIHVAIARLQPGAAPQPALEEPKRGTLAQQAGILCNDVAFRRFLAETCDSDDFAMLDLDMAAEEVRSRCGVKSRADLDRSEDAAAKFRALRGQSGLWCRT